MIDVYGAIGTFADKHRLAQDLARAVMKWKKVHPINLFKKNRAAFIHDLPVEAISNAAGDSNYVRAQVLTPLGALTTKTNSAWRGNSPTSLLLLQMTRLYLKRTWALITKSPDGRWGINGHANTTASIVASARKELS